MKKPIKPLVSIVLQIDYSTNLTVFARAGSGTSLRSSQAATFDTLRARLTNSQTQLMNQHAPFDDRTFILDIPQSSIFETKYRI